MEKTMTTPVRSWAEHPHREGERLRLKVGYDDAGARLATQATVWRYRPAVEEPAPRRLLLVHGFRGDHHGMQCVVDALEEFEVFVPDLPGFGQSAPLHEATGQRAEHSLGRYAGFVDALTGELGLSEQDVLVGHSFGTIVCAAHLAQHSRRWAGLALSAPISDELFRGRLLPGAAGVEAYYRLAALLPEAAGDALLRWPPALTVTNLTMGADWDPEVTAYVREQHRLYFGGYTDRATLLEAYRASSRHTVTEFADRLEVPVALLAGAKDQLSTEKGRRRLRDALPEARLEIIRGTGHLIHYERPAQLARALRRFVSTLQ